MVSHTVEVNITPINDAPNITSSINNITIEENSTTDLAVYTINGEDIDGDENEL